LVIVALVTVSALKRTAGDMVASYRCDRDSRYVASQEYLHIAQKKLGVGDFQSAKQIFKDGIFRLGNDYGGELFWEDTGNWVGLATEHEFKDEHDLAAKAYEKVLEDRLSMYSARWCRR